MNPNITEILSNCSHAVSWFSFTKFHQVANPRLEYITAYGEKINRNYRTSDNLFVSFFFWSTIKDKTSSYLFVKELLCYKCFKKWVGITVFPILQCINSVALNTNNKIPTSVMDLTKRTPSLAPLIFARQSLK